MENRGDMTLDILSDLVSTKTNDPFRFTSQEGLSSQSVVLPLTLTSLTCLISPSPVCTPPPPSLWCTEHYNNPAGLTWRWDMPPQDGVPE